jgi:hypothetical protein
MGFNKLKSPKFAFNVGKAAIACDRHSGLFSSAAQLITVTWSVLDQARKLVANFTNVGL